MSVFCSPALASGAVCWEADVPTNHPGGCPPFAGGALEPRAGFWWFPWPHPCLLVSRNCSHSHHRVSRLSLFQSLIKWSSVPGDQHAFVYKRWGFLMMLFFSTSAAGTQQWSEGWRSSVLLRHSLREEIFLLGTHPLCSVEKRTFGCKSQF